MAKEIVFKKILVSETNLEQWNVLKDTIHVKISEHSGWYLFKDIENGMFVLAQRNGETFRTDVIFVDIDDVPEEKVLKWTDLKIGDVIRCKYCKAFRLIIAIDEGVTPNHICAGDMWFDGDMLKNWEKVGE